MQPVLQVVISFFQMRLKAITAVVGLLLSSTITAAYRIFAFEPSPGRSHWNVMSAALESLLDAGHEIVCATMHRPAESLAGHRNYTHIDMSKQVGTSILNLSYEEVLKRYFDKIFMVRAIVDRENRMCKALIELAEVRDILWGDGRLRFDVIFLESLLSECSTALISHLGLPVVYMIPCPLGHWFTPAVVGSAGHLSYLQHVLHVVQPIPKTFVQRLADVVDYVHMNFVRWYEDPDFSYPRPPNAIMFINTHCSIEPTRPLGSDVHEIGGIHLRPPKPLSWVRA